jgi:hypothetical protein
MAVDGPIRHSADPVSPDASLSPGFVGGSRALDALHQFITSKELLFHPSSPSQVTRPVRDESTMMEQTSNCTYSSLSSLKPYHEGSYGGGMKSNLRLPLLPRYKAPRLMEEE